MPRMNPLRNRALTSLTASRSRRRIHVASCRLNSPRLEAAATGIHVTAASCRWNSPRLEAAATGIHVAAASCRWNSRRLEAAVTGTRAAVEALEVRLVLSTIVVNTLIDQVDPLPSATISLRDAVTRADQSSGPVTISFDPKVFAKAQTITLDNGGLELSNTSGTINIIGPAAGVTIAGAGWTVDTATVSLSGLSTLGISNSGNLTVSNSTISNASFSFGGIDNSGTLVLQNSTISGDGGISYGSGLFNGGTATVTDCTFVNNNVVPLEVPGIATHGAAVNTGPRGTIRPDLGPSNSYGGAIANSGMLTLTNSTVSGNDADFGGAVFNTGTAAVSDCTITANYQQIDNESAGTLTLANTIVAGNSSPPGQPDVIGAIKSPGHNLIGAIDTTSSGWTSTDLTGTDAKPLGPKLSPLGHYGGPTQSQFPQPGSPVLGAGSVALVPPGVITDQRGFARIVGGKVDIGAVEAANASVVTVTPPAAQSVVAGVATSINLGSFTDPGGKGPFTVEVDWGDGSPDSSFPISAIGSLGSQTHAFTDTGSLKGTIFVVDGSGDVSQLATLAVSSAVAPAQSFTVNTTADQTDPAGSTTVSLRDAVDRADASFGPVTIAFDPKVFAAAQTITLKSGLALDGDRFAPITLTGPTAGVTVAGAAIAVDAGITASITRFTSTGGIHNNGTLALSNSVVSGATTPFGGINNVGTMTLAYSTVSGTAAVVAMGRFQGEYYGGSGGGIDNSGTLTVVDSSITGNTAPSAGGGIFNSGTLTVENSTITANQADFGAGIDIDYGGSATLANCTVSGNAASGGGGGIADFSTAPVTLANTIVAANNGAAGPPDVDGTIKSLGHNLIGNTTGSSGWVASDLTGAAGHILNPKLAPLGNHGGPSQTQFPLAGSPAIGAGSVALVPTGDTTDQRGFARVVGGKVDIGAVELQDASLITVTPPATQTVVGGVATSIKLGSFTDPGGKGPFTVDVNWGDDSPDTVFSVTATGSLGSQAHAFIKTGSLTVSVVVSDASGDISQPASFSVSSPAAPISGTVFDDANGDGIQDNGEKGLAGVQVYVDQGNVGYFVAGDPTATTNSTGGYTFSGLAPGNYVIRQVLPFGYVQTAPGNGLGHHVTLGAVALTGENFGDKPVAASAATVTGTVFNDANGDGIQDNGETGLGGVQVYADLGNVGYFVTGDPTTTTNATGGYTLAGLAAGNYIIRQVPPVNYGQTFPLNGLGHHVTVAAGQVLAGQNFGDEV